jgi:hypothetical protein
MPPKRYGYGHSLRYLRPREFSSTSGVMCSADDSPVFRSLMVAWRSAPMRTSSSSTACRSFIAAAGGERGAVTKKKEGTLDTNEF